MVCAVERGRVSGCACGRVCSVLFALGEVVELGPSVAQLVERLTVVFGTVFQYPRKSIGRWFDSGHSDFILPPTAALLPRARSLYASLRRRWHGLCPPLEVFQSPTAPVTRVLASDKQQRRRRLRASSISYRSARSSAVRLSEVDAHTGGVSSW